jgi:uncharacterized protein (DUF1800 family)
MRKLFQVVFALVCGSWFPGAGTAILVAQTVPPPPAITSVVFSNGSTVITFTPYPGADQFRMLSATNLSQPFAESTNGAVSGFTWVAPQDSPFGFYRLEVVPLSSNDLLTAVVLNRLAYGPTPDLLDRVRQIGPQAYIDEQLTPETINETAGSSHPNVALIEGRFADDNTYIPESASSGPGTAHINDLRAWFTLRAVGADRQLLEVLTQFLENHFVTQYSKTYTHFGSFYNDWPTTRQRVFRWRQALMNPQATFHDLLKISAESPAMIIYLDTVTSRADGTRIPNENYSRELMELFTMGVDNGYDQSDIVLMSYVWAGWTVEMVEVGQVDNPFAPKATTKLNTGSSSTAYTNLVGTWTFKFNQTRQRATNLVLFPGRMVDARFGAPWAGRPYQLNLTTSATTNSITNGYTLVAHLADLPYTQEYICVKLCRLFVHDDFAHGYDFTDPNLSPEGRLVRDCMLAWENGSPKGQLRAVLATIFNSDLFRSHDTAFQKVKTPLEYAVSALRAQRQALGGGVFTASTDGYAISGSGTSATPSSAPLSRMGGMYLFERADPDGYPEGAGGWISAGTLAERLRFVQSICLASGQSGKSDAGNNNLTDPVGLLQARLPSSVDQRDAAKVADLFVGLFYPGEGRANLDLYRQNAVLFLNTDDSGNASPFANLTISKTANSAYDNRVRGMAAMLLTLQRFQEQ